MNATVANCVVSGNTTDQNHGAGVLCSGTNVEFVNCLITDNVSAGHGGALYLKYESAVTLTNCTLAENEASINAGGIFVAEATLLTLVNTIVADNTANTGGEIYAAGTVNVDYSNVLGGAAAVVLDGGTLNWGFGNVEGDPSFFFTDDFRLLPNSPCIDAGTNAPAGGLPVADLNGDPRPIDGDGDVEPWSGVAATADIGAYELAEGMDTAICVSPHELRFERPCAKALTRRIRCSRSTIVVWEF